jgi:hypothetical protein
MARENRMTQDMILAEKGGLGVIIGGECCTFILNNTAPDGTITKALQGLTVLSNKLAKNHLTNWLQQWFGKWKRVTTPILTSPCCIWGNGSNWVLCYTLYMGTNS